MGVVTTKTDKYQDCILSCNKCAQACYECFDACLHEQDVAKRTDCMHSLVECAQMCQTAAATMAMSGKFARENCMLCAKVCEECSRHCEMHNDEHCQICAEVCRDCAKECQKMGSIAMA